MSISLSGEGACGQSPRFAGRRAVVTGGASGIGRETCLRLAREGASVLVTDIDMTAAVRVADEIGALNQHASAFEVDVGSAASVSALAGLLSPENGAADVLVNNAGVGATGSILETDDDTWRHLFSINVDGVFRCTQAALPGMLAQGTGSIVNVGSVAGITGLTNRYAYCATKSAVVGMTRAIALDFADTGIRINCVCPGTVRTPWVESFAESSGDPEAFRAQMAARQPIGRMADSQEIATAIAYLASDDAAFITGSAMVIDGGLTAGLAKPPSPR